MFPVPSFRFLDASFFATDVYALRHGTDTLIIVLFKV